MSKTIGTRVDEDIEQRVRAAAERDRRTISNWIRLAIEARLGEQKQQQHVAV